MQSKTLKNCYKIPNDCLLNATTSLSFFIGNIEWTSAEKKTIHPLGQSDNGAVMK